MKKLLLLFVLLVTVFFTATLLIGQKIKVEFYFREIQPFVIDDYVDNDNHEESTIKNISETFSLDYEFAKEIYDNPENYSLMNLDCSVNNKNFFKIYDYRFLNIAHPNVYIIDDYYEASFREIEPDSTESTLVCVIVKNSQNFNEDILTKIKLNIVAFPRVGICFSTDSTYNGHSGVEQLFPLNMKDDLSDVDFDAFFTLSANDETDYNFSSSIDYLTKSIVRENEELYYRFTLFGENNRRYYGFTFFKKEGDLIGGVLLNNFIEKDIIDSIILKKTTYTDILFIDKNAYLIEDGNQINSYHYFEDGSWLKISYELNNNEYVVVGMEQFNSDFDWVSVLTQQDLKLIK